MRTATLALAVLTTSALLASCGSDDPAPPTPLTQQEYQAALTAMDQAMAAAVKAVQSAGSIEALQDARAALVTVVESESRKLAGLLPPTAIATVHEKLHSSLGFMGPAIRDLDITTPPKPDVCGIVAPQVDVAKGSVNVTLRSRHAELKAMTTNGYQIGSFVPTPAPPPAAQQRRGDNGKVLIQSGPRGGGKLRITNKGTSDVVIAVVTSGDPAQPQAMVYVRGSGKAVLTGISGTYWVYEKSGEDWDESRRGFTRDCGFWKWEESFDKEKDWQVTLGESTTDKVATTRVPPF